MNLAQKLDTLHLEVKSNKWFRYFTMFNRIALAAGFIPSGFTKIFDERFTSLAVNHPMGNYLEALYHTGIYYPFIGYVQVIAALLLLIPRTATLGALLYFPIILNICILSLSVGFEGSLVSSPLMVYANLYLICWDYDKLKYIFPFTGPPPSTSQVAPAQTHHPFPIKFFIGVATTIALTLLLLFNIHTKLPRNTYQDCIQDCNTTDPTPPCHDFCACIHHQGTSLSSCTRQYKEAIKDQQ